VPVKRETTPRRLHMGCGENLAGRIPRYVHRVGAVQGASMPALVNPKKGRGGR